MLTVGKRSWLGIPFVGPGENSLGASDKHPSTRPLSFSLPPSPPPRQLQPHPSCSDLRLCLLPPGLAVHQIITITVSLIMVIAALITTLVLKNW